MSRRRLTVMLAVALAVAAASCHKESAPIGEIFTVRMLALSHLQRGELPEAESEFKKLIALAPTEALGYANLGVTLLRAGRLAEAERQLRKARELDPADADIGLTLAKLYSLTNRPAEARATLEELSRNGSVTPRALYALAELEAQSRDSTASPRYEQRLRDVLAVAPANLAVRIKLLEALARRGEADSVVRHLEEIRRLRPEPPKEAIPHLESAIQLLRAGKVAEARAPIDRFVHAMELSAPYQAALEEVKWIEGPTVGRPVLTFAPDFLIKLHGVRTKPTTNAVMLIDATDEMALSDLSGGSRTTAPGLQFWGAAIATGDFNADGTDDLFASFHSAGGAPVVRLYQIQSQLLDFTQRSGVSLPSGAIGAAVGDFDNDGWLDLFVIGGEGRGHLLRNTGSRTFEDITTKSGTGAIGGAQKALFVDLDHDGDLDLLLVGGQKLLVYRNNIDGTFAESAAAMGLAGPGNAHDVVFGDFDGDGRIDLFVTSDGGGNVLYHNGGALGFKDVTGASGITTSHGSGAAAVADYNNDGFLDLFVASVNGGEAELWLNKADGTFTRDGRSTNALKNLRSAAGLAAQFIDYDNDGWLDLIVAGKALASTSPGVFLLHNEGGGRFKDRSTLLPATMRSAGGAAIAVADIDADGDEDIFVAGSAGVRLMRNEGGNSNLAMRVELRGLRTGSGKNNDFGVGAKLQVRAGELLQTRVVTGRVTHFGLGPHLKADVLRVEWPNGVPQTIYFPGTDEDIVEFEMLKGSCAFVYAWDGKHFRFVTDVMWRSALGMPMGLMGGGATAFAPAGASQEYLRIPGSVLQPRDGQYVLQFTEELWETAYADQIRLLAVDHPDSVDVFVDERFVPPGPVNLRMFPVTRPQLPLSATDERGSDVLPALRVRDDVYVSNLTPTRYQGLVEPHDLILDLGPDAGKPGTSLFLSGWIYPTDASINVALSQQTKLRTMMPRLEVRNARGRWTTAIANIGFPSGKDKTIVVGLAGKFPTTDHHVRIRTNMQIYWDQAFVSHDAAASPVRVTTLEPVTAELHFRGYSRTYRKGGRYGPYWFDYDSITTQPPWRPIVGAFTRFGDVLPLLKQPDDMYVIMAPGDEATVKFDATSATTLPPGWKRDFLLYTDGWIKDSDLNTAHGTTVGPLPFHKIESYPYAAGDKYPTDTAHQQYLRQYNTRHVGRR